MEEDRKPRFAEVFPDLAAEIVELLRQLDPALAEVVDGLSYHGPCTCSPTCTNLLTAPLGSSGTRIARLEHDGKDAIWLGLDPTATTITDVEILDGRDLGLAARRPKVT